MKNTKNTVLGFKNTYPGVQEFSPNFFISTLTLWFNSMTEG